MKAKSFLVLLVSVGSMFACGGAQTPAKKAERAATAAEEAPEADSPPAKKANSYCSDGTCFRCGGSFCPKGWFCDEKAAGGPSCSWLPGCAASANCSCIESALGSGCNCTEREGGVFVSCG